MTKIAAVGSRAQVMHGTADHTSGGLTKGDLKYNKSGVIVSRKKSKMAKARLSKDADLKAAFRENAKYMKEHGKAPPKAQAAKP